MNVLLLCAGSSASFVEAGHSFPKCLVEVAGEPVIQRVLESQTLFTHGSNRLFVLVQQEENRRHHIANVLRLLVPTVEVLEVPAATAGAACSALLAIDCIPGDEPLLVVNGDVVVEKDLRTAVESFDTQGLDGGVVVFKAVHPRWSYVRLDENGFVVETAEKRPISNLATAGLYWWRTADRLWRSSQRMIAKDAHVDGAFYICPAYNELVLDGGRIGVHEIETSRYHSLANPAGVRQYENHLGGGTDR